uniref:CCHC-type domain-containing protein n=1 Tax=Neogobius melanostomus TaxID=47308 RepID=A0A8C6SK68_9GOBI
NFHVAVMSDDDGAGAAPALAAAPAPRYAQLNPPVPLNFAASDLFTDLDRTLSTARAFEAAQAESKLFTESPFHKAGDDRVRFTGTGARVDRRQNSTRGGRGNREQSNSTTQCYRCGMDSHTAEECGAKTATCHFCQKTGHYARMCFKKKKKGQAEKNSDKSKEKQSKVNQREQ